MDRISRGIILWVRLVHVRGPCHCPKNKKATSSYSSTSNRFQSPLMAKFQVSRWTIKRRSDRSHGRLRNSGNRCACPQTRWCSCNFFARLLRSRCVALPWKTGCWGCAAAPISSQSVLAVQQGSSGGPTLMSSGGRRANRSPPLPLLSARPRCPGIVRAVETFCCSFLCCAQFLTTLSYRTSGSNRCALFGLVRTRQLSLPQTSNRCAE